MNHNTQGVSRNGNQGSSGQARLEPTRGRQGLGNLRQNAPTLGAGATSAPRLGNDHAPANPKGGQSALGLVGLPGTGTRQPQAKAPAPALAVRLRRDRLEVSVRLSKRDELFDESPVQMTPAMHAAARAADERDRRGYVDDEEAEFAHRCAGAGYVEITLAMEGN